MADRHDVTFTAADGTTLAGWLYRPDTEGPWPAITMAHGSARPASTGWLTTDLALIGTVNYVAAQLQRYRDAGVTDLILSPFQNDPAVLQGVWELAAGVTYG